MPTAPASRTIKLTVEYDGTGLAGWQRQDNGPSIQGHLEDALARMLGEPLRVVGASRTDAGVHARGQVCHVELTHDIPTYGLRRGLNGHLPPAIAVLDAAEVAPGFHARFSARGKRYCYTLLCRAERSPLRRHLAWHRPRRLDLAAMRGAAAQLVGEHDFSAFRAAGCTARHAVREITGVDLYTAGELVTIEVRGNAFVRNMVRILAGTLVAVGEGRVAADAVAEILASRDRTQAGQTAPAHGLCLVEVFYDADALRTAQPLARDMSS